MSSTSTTNRLHGKVVLITGASAGFGEACAYHYAALGCKLILLARREERLHQVANAIKERYGTGVTVHVAPCDVRDSERVAALPASLPDELKQVDVLILNAGLALGVHKTFEHSLENAQIMMDTNYMGVLRFVKAFVPAMIARGTASQIVVVGSIAGIWSYPNGSGYCASKFAVRAFTDALRIELVGTPIRVTHIAPGLADTEFSIVRLGDVQAAKNWYAGLNPLTADDVADTIVYVTSVPDHVQISELVVMPACQASCYHVHRTPTNA